MGKTCFFIGHRDSPQYLAPILRNEVERHISQYDVTEFIVGMYGSFDQMAGRTVISLKREHPDIKLFRLLAYHPAERNADYPDGYDGTVYPAGLETTPRQFAIVKANRRIISQSDYLIAYVAHPASNAIKFLEYAIKLEKQGRIHVQNIYKWTDNP